MLTVSILDLALAEDHIKEELLHNICNASHYSSERWQFDESTGYADVSAHYATAVVEQNLCLILTNLYRHTIMAYAMLAEYMVNLRLVDGLERGGFWHQ